MSESMNATVQATAAPAALGLTHVLYDANSYWQFLMALITLSPILLMASYASLVVMTRELLVINMWIGQVTCEVFNWLLKRAIKEERPPSSYGNGYGFPSSHSQYMGYFASFLICHICLRHRLASCQHPLIEKMVRFVICIGLGAWAAAVCYSRYELTYHSPSQITWGASIGLIYGTLTYLLTELLPALHPTSSLGLWRRRILASELFTWLRIRDGWAIWEDGGEEAEWRAWRAQWERKFGVGERGKVA